MARFLKKFQQIAQSASSHLVGLNDLPLDNSYHKLNAFPEAAEITCQEPDIQVLPHPVRVPKGYVPVLVGLESCRFYMIRASDLNHPLLSIVLRRSAEEFGYSQPGPLRVHCDTVSFEQLMSNANLK